MKIMLINTVLGLALLVLIAVVVLAWQRGRDSGYYQLLGKLTAPVNHALLAEDTRPPLSLPFTGSGSDVLADWQWFPAGADRCGNPRRRPLDDSANRKCLVEKPARPDAVSTRLREISASLWTCRCASAASPACHRTGNGSLPA